MINAAFILRVVTPSESTAIIQAAGGNSQFGRLIGIDGEPGWQQRVNNWKRRGIPAAIELEHYDTIARLRPVRRKRSRPN